jgi:hypothetical protein
MGVLSVCANNTGSAVPVAAAAHVQWFACWRRPKTVPRRLRRRKITNVDG